MMWLLMYEYGIAVAVWNKVVLVTWNSVGVKHGSSTSVKHDSRQLWLFETFHRHRSVGVKHHSNQRGVKFSCSSKPADLNLTTWNSFKCAANYPAMFTASHSNCNLRVFCMSPFDCDPPSQTKMKIVTDILIFWYSDILIFWYSVIACRTNQ